MLPDNSEITNIIGMGWYKKMAYIFDLFVNAMNATPRVALVLYAATAGIDFTITIARCTFQTDKVFVGILIFAAPV